MPAAGGPTIAATVPVPQSVGPPTSSGVIHTLPGVELAKRLPFEFDPMRECKGKIEIEGLSFRYGENLPFLYQDFGFTVEPGKVVAIMGPSGSGKSTLAKLLQGFYVPAGGTIKLDGNDIRHLSANELRHYFGVVPQETILFSGTVGNK
jgi:subfamily B ATP-binding cassette protein HlyB/CyaB